ncbi:hypothetical protein ACH9EU_03490 [Kocuria sp. M1R5S2]|uniref:hypothetical protein n=1 Tax=Kocuria rhizosphaerae TaxID=3376285 RepID=UPI00378C6301
MAAAAAAAIAHLVAGFFYLSSGLVAPLPAVAMLLLWWAVLACAGMWLVARRSYLVLAVPVVAVLTWLGLMWFGGALLGWRG